MILLFTQRRRWPARAAAAAAAAVASASVGISVFGCGGGGGGGWLEVFECELVCVCLHCVMSVPTVVPSSGADGG